MNHRHHHDSTASMAWSLGLELPNFGGHLKPEAGTPRVLSAGPNYRTAATNSALSLV